MLIKQDTLVNFFQTPCYILSFVSVVSREEIVMDPLPVPLLQSPSTCQQVLTGGRPGEGHHWLAVALQHMRGGARHQVTEGYLTLSSSDCREGVAGRGRHSVGVEGLFELELFYNLTCHERAEGEMEGEKEEGEKKIHTCLYTRSHS